jgi:hypothetical protein
MRNQLTTDDFFDDECHAEMIDGSYTYCGCKDCDEREREDREEHMERTGESY